MPDSAGAPRSVKTTVELPSELWRAAKIKAIGEHTDLRSVIIAALTVYLGEADADRNAKVKRRR